MLSNIMLCVQADQSEMSAIYDNWERLVAAVLKKEQLWQLFHADSIDPSIRSESLSYSSSFKLSSRTSDFAASSWIRGPAASPYQQRQNPGVFSTISYRSVMDNGITTVVNRLRDAGVSQRHLDQNMEVSRGIRHENAASHEVFFSYGDEMLVIYEYQSQGAVLTLMQHEKKLEWESRAWIAICVARAIANAHSQCYNKLASKDVKAGDPFLNSQDNDCLSDLGLENMSEVSIIITTAGYRAPEVNYDEPPSQASDIYSFGVLLIELLTGALPMNDSVDDKMHMVRHVTHKFREAGTLVVFDFVPVSNPRELIEMWKTLLVAMRCLDDNPEQRPKSSDILNMMESIKSVPPKNGS